MVAALAILAVSVLLAGCGGSDSSSSASPLSKAEYVKQGNAICTKGLEEKDQAVKAGLESIPRNEFPNISQQSLAMLGESALPAYQKVADELGELSPPAKDKARVEKLLSEFEAAISETEAAPIKLAKGDPFRKTGDAAAAYGLESCNL